MQNRRSDVIRQISVDGKVRCFYHGAKIDREHIAFDDFDISQRRCDFAQSRGEPVVQFDGDDLAGISRQLRSHLAMTRANFDPHSISNANRARDSFLPACIAKKMLSQLFR